MVLNGEHYIKLTANPELFKRNPFLKPMEGAAANLHAKLSKVECKGCIRKALGQAAFYLGNAFIALVNKQKHVDASKLQELKVTIQSMLETTEDIIIKYRTDKGVPQEITL